MNSRSPEGKSATVRDIAEFDREHKSALQRIWFLGDVHGNFQHISKALFAVQEKLGWLVFLGDVDIKDIPFREILAPLKQSYPGIRIAFIHGNHDADTLAQWNMLHDCGDAEVLHGKVVDMDGVRVAGLGGNFMGRVWNPPAEEKFQSKDEAMRRGSHHSRNGQAPKPALHAAIYPADLKALSKQRADILVTHEAPSGHHHKYTHPHPNKIDNLRVTTPKLYAPNLQS